MERIDIEEKNAKCNICSGDLSIIENMLYGNRCVFCFEGQIINISITEYLWKCYLDWKIYQLSFIMARKIMDKDDIRNLYLGCLTEAGLTYEGAKTVKEKARLIKVLKRYAK